MSYTEETKLSPAMRVERKLLRPGMSYSEVAAQTGAKIGTVKERNRLIYGVDLRETFRARVHRDGIKSRYVAGNNFGHWFSGYFDGEGCFTVFFRRRRGYAERRVGIQVACRYDDAEVLRYIHQNLGAGVFWESQAKGTTAPASNWRIESAADLAEIVLPVFDDYPLRSKKRHEYAIWRELVLKQYVNTLGGTSTRVGASEVENVAFQEAMNEVRKIRHPSGGRSPTFQPVV